MGTTIATKADLQILRQETRTDLAGLSQELALLRKDLEIMSERLAMMANNVTVRLGATMAVLTGLLVAALKLT